MPRAATALRLSRAGSGSGLRLGPSPGPRIPHPTFHAPAGNGTPPDTTRPGRLRAVTLLGEYATDRRRRVSGPMNRGPDPHRGMVLTPPTGGVVPAPLKDDRPDACACACACAGIGAGDHMSPAAGGQDLVHGRCQLGPGHLDGDHAVSFPEDDDQGLFGRSREEPFDGRPDLSGTDHQVGLPAPSPRSRQGSGGQRSERSDRQPAPRRPAEKGRRGSPTTMPPRSS